ncbi:hypothetical protein V6N12_071262 [Hibiscus sabdariffa]|uniref:Uncharacterized protein n=1 Tax=Hibiscus sabdariffa TaxID=183260 RepID=A0ABR2FJT3_9ROSI
MKKKKALDPEFMKQLNQSRMQCVSPDPQILLQFQNLGEMNANPTLSPTITNMHGLDNVLGRQAKIAETSDDESISNGFDES